MIFKPELVDLIRRVQLDDLTEMDRRSEDELGELREHASIAAQWMLASISGLTIVERAIWRSTPAGLACTALETFAGLCPPTATTGEPT